MLQQPGLQQMTAGWPTVPGLQTAPFGSPGPQFPPQAPAPQPYPGQSYMVYPPFGSQPGGRPPGPQPQGAQVPPVTFPASPYSGGPSQQGQQAPPSPAQMLARQLTEVARTLEQMIPGFQLVQSALLDLTAAGSPPMPGLGEAVKGLKDALYYHGAALGAIRRLLMGETSPAVLTNLAAAVQRLGRVQSESRHLVERVTQNAPAPMRGAAVNLAQSTTAADALLGQATAAIQALVGPQVWEAARQSLQS
jgi:hypothetical protein